MRILALDVGDRRIGVALSDPLGIAAAPLTTIDRAGRRDEVAAVVELAEDHEVVQIAVGMPLTLSGEIGHQASKVQDFIGLLAAQTDLPVFTPRRAVLVRRGRAAA